VPNSSPEHTRLETQAKLVSGIMHGNIFHAPIPDRRGSRMLDIGCGTGIVTDDMSQRYPQAECIGLDLSRVPQLRQQNPNRLDTRCGEKTAQWMREAGFVDVQVTPYKWASCGITEETPELRVLGKFNAENVPKMLHFAIERAIADGHVPSEEMRRRIEELRKEMRETLVSGTGLHCIMYVTIGRKP
ncbi:hypothetical protein CERZMDRAFT_41341, partial [Cercospora zeae-maydis SCOH1-5]